MNNYNPAQNKYYGLFKQEVGMDITDEEVIAVIKGIFDNARC